MAGGMLGVRAGRRGWLRSAGAAGTAALAALMLSGGSAAAATGPHWTQVASPDPGAVYNYLTGVSCASARFCMGVGYYYNGTVWQTLVLRWNGTRWAKVASPDPGVTDYNDLYGVSCPSATFCMAVGYYFNGTTPQTLVLKWNGTRNRWARVSSPGPGDTSELYGVSCTGARFCMADGYYYNGTADRHLVLRWNGTRWAQVSSPDPSTAQYSALYAVSCPSARFCMASGYYYNGTAGQTLMLKWNGTRNRWAQVSSPDPGAGSDNYLYGVSCPSARFCMADGYYHNGTAAVWQTLTARWNGTRWAKTASPDPGATAESFLAGVSCPSARFCMADGYYSNGTPDQTLVLRWNGTSWAHVASPDSSTAEYNYPYGVSCTSATFCLATGEYYNGAVNKTLAEKW